MSAEPPKLTLIHQSPTVDSRLRWADGTLKGIKTLVWREDRVLSPLHRVEWHEARLTAEDFWVGEHVRNKGGIHAIWPPSLTNEGEDVALQEFERYARQRAQDFTCLVAGWGRCVMGDVGWRAEFAVIRNIISPPSHAQRKFREWCRTFNVKWSVI